MPNAASNTPFSQAEDIPCRCRKHAIDPNCPRHGIGHSRYLLNLITLVVLVAVLAVAVFTAPAQGVIQ